MGLMKELLLLPAAPLRGTVLVAEQVMRVAEDELYDPARIRRELEAVDAARQAGTLTDDEADDLEDELVERLTTAHDRRRRRR
ncbi:gas vesicle protein GvpG [Nocardioidaceae bacterium]|nr:gas vesicle protein GvpG [Nocardioidaceae bacterium]